MALKIFKFWERVLLPPKAQLEARRIKSLVVFYMDESKNFGIN